LAELIQAANRLSSELRGAASEQLALDARQSRVIMLCLVCARENRPKGMLDDQLGFENRGGQGLCDSLDRQA